MKEGLVKFCADLNSLSREGLMGAVALYPGFCLTCLGDNYAREVVRQLCETVAENECDGALFTLYPDKVESLKVIREVFGI